MIKKTATIFLTTCLGASIAFSAPIAVAAQDDAPAGEAQEKKKLTRWEKRLKRIMEKYEFTGEERSCISLRSVKSTSVVDNNRIFFDAAGKKAYMNVLDRACPRLKYEERFAYRTTIGQLCNVDLITVLDNYGRSWSSCGLGKFKEMRLIPKEDRVKSDD